MTERTMAMLRVRVSDLFQRFPDGLLEFEAEGDCLRDPQPAILGASPERCQEAEPGEWGNLDLIYAGASDGLWNWLNEQAANALDEKLLREQ